MCIYIYIYIYVSYAHCVLTGAVQMPAEKTYAVAAEECTLLLNMFTFTDVYELLVKTTKAVCPLT